MNKKIKYWVDIADYDLETAKAMLQSKRYLYVGFMCHQAVEKILKAYYIKLTDTQPKFTHRLTYLTESTKLEDELSDEQKYFIDELEPPTCFIKIVPAATFGVLESTAYMDLTSPKIFLNICMP